MSPSLVSQPCCHDNVHQCNVLVCVVDYISRASLSEHHIGEPALAAMTTLCNVLVCVVDSS